MKSYDSMLDDLPGGYQEYCRRLEIPNIYGNKENFIRSYAYDKVNMNSIVSNLIRAYDNAIVLREEIGSEALAYIQLGTPPVLHQSLRHRPCRTDQTEKGG